MRDDRERLFDIQEAIERIEQYAKQGQETFELEMWNFCKNRRSGRTSGAGGLPLTYLL